MKVEFTPLEENAVRIALSEAIDREMSFQRNCPDCVSQFDRNYLEFLRSAHRKLF